MNSTIVRLLLPIAALLASACSSAGPDRAPANDAKPAEELLVRFADGTEPDDAERLIQQLGARLIERVAPQLYRLRPPPGMALAEAIERLQGEPQVRYVEPNTGRRPYTR